MWFFVVRQWQSSVTTMFWQRIKKLREKTNKQTWWRRRSGGRKRLRCYSRLICCWLWESSSLVIRPVSTTMVRFGVFWCLLLIELSAVTNWRHTGLTDCGTTLAGLQTNSLTSDYKATVITGGFLLTPSLPLSHEMTLCGWRDVKIKELLHTYTFSSLPCTHCGSAPFVYQLTRSQPIISVRYKQTERWLRCKTFCLCVPRLVLFMPQIFSTQ